MAVRDLSALDTDMHQGLGRIIQEAFDDGIDCDVKVTYGNKLKLADSSGDYIDIYVDSGGNLVLPATTSVTYLDDDGLNFGTSSDVSMVWNGTNFVVNSLAEDTGEFQFGPTTAIDVSIYANTNTKIFKFDANSGIVEINDWDMHLQDDDELQFGDATGGDVSIVWDVTNLLIEAYADNTGQIRIGSTNAIDFAVYGSTNTNIALFDVSTPEIILNGWDLELQDDDILTFGDSDDMQIKWDQSQLAVNAGSANGVINIGKGTITDVIMQGVSADADLHWDGSEDTLGLLDDAILGFGGTAAAPDITVTWDTSRLLIDGANENTAIWIGHSNNQDVIIYGDTTTDAITFDTSAETVTFTDFNITMSGTTSAVITCAIQSDLGGLTLPNSATGPTSEDPGDYSLYFETDTSCLWVHTGSGTWVSTAALS